MSIAFLAFLQSTLQEAPNNLNPRQWYMSIWFRALPPILKKVNSKKKNHLCRNK